MTHGSLLSMNRRTAANRFALYNSSESEHSTATLSHLPTPPTHFLWPSLLPNLVLTNELRAFTASPPSSLLHGFRSLEVLKIWLVRFDSVALFYQQTPSANASSINASVAITAAAGTFFWKIEDAVVANESCAIRWKIRLGRAPGPTRLYL